MNRTVVGFVLLVVLLAGGIASGLGIQKHSDRVAGLLDMAAEQAMGPEFSAAVETAAEARQVWEQGWSVAAVLTDHAPLEQIDAGFSRLRIYGEAGDALAFAVICAELSGQVQAIADGHGTQWWNLL